MDFKRYVFICAIVLLWLPLSEAGCKEDLQTDSKFKDCTTGIFGYMLSVGQFSLPDSLTDAANLICSTEGRKAFGCMIPYIDKCNALIEITTVSSLISSIEQIPMFDLQLLKGGIEDICAVLVGPCREVNNCIANLTEENGGTEKTDAPDLVNSHINNYHVFTVHTLKICGELKTPMDCMLHALELCPPSVTDVAEKKFDKALKIATQDDFGNLSFRDAKNFILNVCPKKPKDFVTSMCYNVLSSPNFTECNINATMKYSEEKTCTVHDLSKQCIMTHLEPTCGVQESLPGFYEKMKSRLRTVEEGADTIVWLAVAESAVKQKSGAFFQDRQVVSTHLPLSFTSSTKEQDQKLINQLDDLAKQFQSAGATGGT